MKIFFLNCNNRGISDKINELVQDEKLDMVILAESNNILELDGFTYVFRSQHKLGLRVFSKINFLVEELNYIIDNEKLLKENTKQYDRLINIQLENGVSVFATHIDYGWYNPFAMNKLLEEAENRKPNIIIGDFNSGYIEDSIDYETGGIVFQNGYLYFDKLEDMGYVDLLKGKGLYTHINTRSKRRFRIDHCFNKNINDRVTHVDTFLEDKVSDHAGLICETNEGSTYE